MTLPLLATAPAKMSIPSPSSASMPLIEILGGASYRSNPDNYRRERHDPFSSTKKSKYHTKKNMAIRKKTDDDEPKKSEFYNDIWMNIPTYIRFGISAGIGNIIFYFLDQYLYQNVFIGQDTLSFFVAYLSQVFLQHLLNSILVYGFHTIDTWGKYRSTLIATYSAYFGTLIASTCFNTFLLQYGGVQKKIAFWSTLAIFGVVNYLLLNKYVAGEDADAHSTKQQQQQRFLFLRRRMNDLFSYRHNVASFFISLFIRQTSTTTSSATKNSNKRGYV